LPLCPEMSAPDLPIISRKQEDERNAEYMLTPRAGEAVCKAGAQCYGILIADIGPLVVPPQIRADTDRECLSCQKARLNYQVIRALDAANATEKKE